MYIYSIIALFLLPMDHDIHVSVSDITEGSSDRQLISIVRIFLDDLQLALGYEAQEFDTDDTTFKSAVDDYLKNHYKLTTGERLLTHRLNGLEYENLALYCTLIYDEVDLNKMESIKVENKILQDIYFDQMNMINCHLSKKTRSKALMSGKSSATFKINRN